MGANSSFKNLDHSYSDYSRPVIDLSKSVPDDSFNKELLDLFRNMQTVNNITVPEIKIPEINIPKLDQPVIENKFVINQEAQEVKVTVEQNKTLMYANIILSLIAIVTSIIALAGK